MVNAKDSIMKTNSDIFNIPFIEQLNAEDTNTLIAALLFMISDLRQISNAAQWDMVTLCKSILLKDYNTIQRHLQNPRTILNRHFKMVKNDTYLAESHFSTYNLFSGQDRLPEFRQRIKDILL